MGTSKNKKQDGHGNRETPRDSQQVVFLKGALKNHVPHGGAGSEVGQASRLPDWSVGRASRLPFRGDAQSAPSGKRDARPTLLPRGLFNDFMVFLIFQSALKQIYSFPLFDISRPLASFRG
ncbi:MAG: hypothetical protein LBC18_14200 [Opitutaceae bacterium]|jgi:hypothetical protein|nr:hypothetical protein [Opitutaceae bacterium]